MVSVSILLLKTNGMPCNVTMSDSVLWIKEENDAPKFVCLFVLAAQGFFLSCSGIVTQIVVTWEY